jgi:hypothetical protein
MQLSIDHIQPRSSGGDDGPHNRIVACRACNSITSRMQFSPDATREEILRQKRARVAERRREFYRWWSTSVAPHYLDRPLPPI